MESSHSVFLFYLLSQLLAHFWGHRGYFKTLIPYLMELCSLFSKATNCGFDVLWYDWACSEVPDHSICLSFMKKRRLSSSYLHTRLISLNILWATLGGGHYLSPLPSLFYPKCLVEIKCAFHVEAIKYVFIEWCNVNGI